MASRLVAYPRLNNLYFRFNAQARRDHAVYLLEEKYKARIDSLAASNIAADPLRTRRIVAGYQATLESRINRIRTLMGKTIQESFKAAGPVTAAVKDGEVGRFSLLDPERGVAEFQAWTQRTMMSVLLDSSVATVAPVAGHFLISVNAQTIGVAAVQAFDAAKVAGITISSELEEFVQLVRSVEPADIAATRQFGLLRNMSFETGDVLRDELVDGIRLKKSADEIASVIDRKLVSMNLARAKTIVRTEITFAHANATLNAFRLSGIRTVEAQLEFTLQVHGNSPPCPICIDLSGKIYTVDAAKNVIPLHANCQCGWIPVFRK